MHKHIFFKLSFLFLLLLTMAACSLDAEDNGEASLEPGEFWARDLRTNKWYKVSAQKLYEGSRCIIWVERGLNVSTAQAEQVAAEYSTNIYSKIIGTFGDVLDVDDNGKVILLLMDIIDGGSNNSYTAGYFDSTQMVKTTSDKPSNEADMLYIDAKQSKVCSPGFYSTIAHELAHLINYSQKEVPTGTTTDTWINEGFALAAEYLYAVDPNDRILYQTLINHSTGKTREYQQAYGWTQDNCKDTFFIWDGSLEDYSTAFLFFQWLRIQSTNGLRIWQDIMKDRSPRYNAVLNAMDAEIDGSSIGIGTVFDPEGNPNKWTWAEALGVWFAANYNATRLTPTPGSPPELASYGEPFTSYFEDAIARINTALGSRPQIDHFIEPLQFAENVTSFDLKSGEGLISGLNGNMTNNGGSGTNIQFWSVQTDGTIANKHTFPISASNVLIGFNTNTANIASTGTQIANFPKGIVPPVFGGSISASTSLSRSASAAPLKPFKLPMTDLVINVNGTVAR